MPSGLLAAAQATVTHAFVEQRQAWETELGVTLNDQLKGIEAEVGLARGESPFVGAAMTHGHRLVLTSYPNTKRALADGRVSEYHARIVAEQTTHLSDAHRRRLMAGLPTGWARPPVPVATRLIQGHAYRLDRKAAEQRAAQNTRRRRVGVDHGSDGISYLTADLPTHQAVAVMDALTKWTNERLAAHRRRQTETQNAPGDTHPGPETDAPSLSRDQTMADVFVELLTGQTTAAGVTAEVVVVMSDTSLFGNDDVPAWIPGRAVSAGMVETACS